MLLLSQTKCPHGLSIHFPHCAVWHWDWWFWWPAGLLFSQWPWGSWRRHCEQSQHSEIFCPTAVLQAPWGCGPGISRSHWPTSTLFSCCSPNHVGHQDLWPLNLLFTLLSVPLGFCWFCLILTYRSDWCWMNSLVLFLTLILGFRRGLRAAMTPSRRWLPLPRHLREREEKSLWTTEK